LSEKTAAAFETQPLALSAGTVAAEPLVPPLAADDFIALPRGEDLSPLVLPALADDLLVFTALEPMPLSMTGSAFDPDMAVVRPFGPHVLQPDDLHFGPQPNDWL
jgi:hypothetical protein